MKVFEVIKRGKGNFVFLIVPNGSNISICDEDGNNYGNYSDPVKLVRN